MVGAAALLSPGCRGWALWELPGAVPAPRAGAVVGAWNETLFVFGGRGDDARAPHDPRTFEIAKVNGSYVFATYDGKPVRTCEPGVGYHECYDTDVGTRFNDVWALPLDCARSGGGGCGGRGWARVLAGAKMGGCKLVGGVDVCSHPCERVGAGGGVLRDGTLLVYGGYGEMCEDYCADAWTLNLGACLGWRAAAAPCAWVQHGGAGRGEAEEEGRLDDARATDPFAPPPTRPPGPGKRRGMAHAQPTPSDAAALFGPPAGSNASNSRGDGGRRWEWVMFGGHRLWHGFAAGNSLANSWNESTPQLPFGGYLDDLWTAAWEPASSSSSAASPSAGRLVWRQVRPREGCYAHVGPTWEARHELACAVTWPPARASAALAVHGRSLFLHGGFGASYPYPQVLGRGAGAGTAALASESRGAYPTRPYHLSDLWRFDVDAGLWSQLAPTPAAALPGARRGHSLTSLGVPAGALLLVGGSDGNDLFGETWLLDVSTTSGGGGAHWVRKRTHVQPLLPLACTSDVLLEGAAAEGITAATLFLRLPPTLLNGSADARSLAAFRAALAAGGPYISETPAGPLVTLGASVAGEPTRGLPGVPPLRVPQPRRRAPGWDGCRDRADGRGDLPQELQWLSPGQRAEHAAVAVAAVAGGEQLDVDGGPRVVLLLGGDVLPRGQEAPSGGRTTQPTRTDGGLWSWHPRACPSNCSHRGECALGFCTCRPGWYGVDCSNATCPGDWVVTDALNRIQRHTPCCSAAVFVPPPGSGAAAGGGATLAGARAAADAAAAAEALDSWANPWRAATDTRFPYRDEAGLQKAACSERVRGRSRGTCDGFGGCQCVPPFTGPDCAVLDCPRNCSGRGVCALDFPVGRCLCESPFGGADCSSTLCLNNCSWPHGACNTTTGVCACGWAMHPTNRSQRYRPYAGPDCSFLTPAAAAPAATAPSVWAVAAGAAAAAALAAAAGGGAAWRRRGR